MQAYLPKPEDKPHVGQIYRDRFNRSMLVWRVADDRVVVEYADGHVTAVGRSDWSRMVPRPARF